MVILKRVLTAAFVAGMGTAAMAAEPADFAGRWEVAAHLFGQPALYDPLGEHRLVLAADGGRYTGTFNDMTLSGTRQADGLHLACTRPAGTCGDLVLTLANGMLTGKGTLGGEPVTLTGNRPLTRRAPRVLDYAQKDYQLWFSGHSAPVLHLVPGDTLRTRTIDAKGFDEHHVERSQHGNPEVGPFYVEGAMPGDTLVVHLKRLRTNRDTALQADNIFPSAFDPDYLRGLSKIPPGGHNYWKLDPKSGTATLVAPGEKLKNFTIPLDPMLGCIGVAPPMGEQVLTHHLGPYGGNMDYNRVHEGATLYLPMSRKGALLYFGDAHAQMGDGELTGQGLETSMDVEITVDVIEGKAAGAPVLEDKGDIMIMGIGPSLDAAFKSANTQTAQWLTDTYHLTQADVAMVLGSVVKFDIAEVVDPEFNVVARIPAGALAGIPKP